MLTIKTLGISWKMKEKLGKSIEMTAPEKKALVSSLTVNPSARTEREYW